MQERADEFNEEPQDASFSVTDSGKMEVKEAKEGRVMDQEETLANLEGALKNMSGHVAIVEGPAPEPEISTAEVQSYRPKEVIGEYQTDFLWDSNPNRKYNMKLAAKSVNNTVLEPGEVFSFNDLTKTLDYKEAKTFSNGGVGIANGGGLCQVSSTLYMAANYAGLRIVERHPHYAVLPYIKPGFDATVWFGENGWGAQDMRFENNTDGYIVIREWVDEKGLLNAQILGQPTGKKVEMSTEKIYEASRQGDQVDNLQEGDRRRQGDPRRLPLHVPLQLQPAPSGERAALQDHSPQGRRVVRPHEHHRLGKPPLARFGSVPPT